MQKLSFLEQIGSNCAGFSFAIVKRIYDRQSHSRNEPH